MATSDGPFQELWGALENALDYRFRDRDLLHQALTHRSYANERSAAEFADNERLEFLGDAVLDLVVSRYLYQVQPAFPEGEMTRIRADVVAEPSLARMAGELAIGPALLLGKGEERSAGRSKPSLLANALEALFGAVFVDGGFAAAEAVILPLFVPLLQQSSHHDGLDFKSRLQESLQGRRMGLPEYRLIEVQGPAHQRHYLIEVIVEGQASGRGEGRTKKIAEQAAARVALAALNGER